MQNHFISEGNANHLCSTNEDGENTTHCAKCENTRKASTENLTRLKHTDEQGHTVTSTRSSHVSHLSEKGSLSRSVEPARITSCGEIYTHCIQNY